MFQTKKLFVTDDGHYVVQLAPIGYIVLRMPTGDPIAWCAQLETARAIAESREWADECDENT